MHFNSSYFGQWDNSKWLDWVWRLEHKVRLAVRKVDQTLLRSQTDSTWAIQMYHIWSFGRKHIQKSNSSIYCWLQNSAHTLNYTCVPKYCSFSLFFINKKMHLKCSIALYNKSTRNCHYGRSYYSVQPLTLQCRIQRLSNKMWTSSIYLTGLIHVLFFRAVSCGP